MNRVKKKLAFLVTLMIGAVLAACGGGGGGGPAGTAYTGNSSAAVITEENATEITLAAYSGGLAANPEGVFPMAVNLEEDETTSVPLGYLVDLARDLRSRIEASGATTGESQVKALSNSQGEDGPCGGNLVWSGTSDLYAPTGNVTIVFNDYSDCATILSGKIRVTWSTDALSFFFEPLTVMSTGSSPAESFTFSGKLDWKESENQNSWKEIMTLNLVLVDHVAEKDYKFDNYRISYTIPFFGTVDQIELTGRYFDFAYGRVEISTPQPVLVQWPYSYYWPEAGIIQFNGAASSTRIVFVTDGVRIELRPSLSGEGWELQQFIPKTEFDIWF